VHEIKETIHKNKFAFSRASRQLSEMERPLYNHSIGYNIKTDFDKIERRSGSGATFGGQGQRFEYYSNRRKQGALPSPLDYNSTMLQTCKGFKSIGLSDAPKTSFGLGRDKVTRMHVDAILYKGLTKDADCNPGPGQHDVNKKWASPKDHSLSKTNPIFSFSKAPKDKGDHFNKQFYH
jgi:hypothetical protein